MPNPTQGEVSTNIAESMHTLLEIKTLKGLTPDQLAPFQKLCTIAENCAKAINRGEQIAPDVATLMREASQVAAQSMVIFAANNRAIRPLSEDRIAYAQTLENNLLMKVDNINLNSIQMTVNIAQPNYANATEEITAVFDEVDELLTKYMSDIRLGLASTEGGAMINNLSDMPLTKAVTLIDKMSTDLENKYTDESSRALMDTRGVQSFREFFMSYESFAGEIAKAPAITDFDFISDSVIENMPSMQSATVNETAPPSVPDATALETPLTQTHKNTVAITAASQNSIAKFKIALSNVANRSDEPEEPTDDATKRLK